MEYKSKKVLEKDQKLAHRIKLKKRLEKAKLKLSSSAATTLNDNYINIEEDENCVSGKKIQKKHEERKPDPAKKALEKAKQIQLQKEQAEFERKLHEKKRQKQIIATKKRRKGEKDLLFKKTKRGQPILSNQISHLLSKISK